MEKNLGHILETKRMYRFMIKAYIGGLLYCISNVSFVNNKSFNKSMQIQFYDAVGFFTGMKDYGVIVDVSARLVS